tara:strand:+ start:306 stop:473 length:168 start_codon:yes stop_codon:yes gene_type:complete
MVYQDQLQEDIFQVVEVVLGYNRLQQEVVHQVVEMGEDQIVLLLTQPQLLLELLM